MTPFGSNAQIRDDQTVVPEQPIALPYDIRTEINWIDFSATSNPFGAPRELVQELHSALVEGDLSFTPDRESHALRRVLSRYYETSPNCFLCGTSTPRLITTVSQAFRPCTVGIVTPGPAEYFVAISNAGHTPVRLSNPQSLAMVDAQTARKSGTKFDAAVLANPSYPCSRLLTEQTLIGYLDTCRWVIVDESLIQLSFSGESFATLTKKYKNLIVIESLSESFGMPGMPLGYIQAHSETIDVIRRFNDATDTSLISEVFASKLPSLTGYLEETQKALEKEIPTLHYRLSLIPGIRVFPTEGNFIMCALEERASNVFKISGLDDLLTKLQLGGFLVRDLSGTPGIDPGAKRYFCIAVRTPEENEKLLAFLRKIIDED